MVMVELDMRQRPVIVIGGGPVAERRLARLLDEAPSITLVSPQVTPQLARWAQEERFLWKQASYPELNLADLLKGNEPKEGIGASESRLFYGVPSVLVLIATPDEAINAAIAREAGQLGCLVARTDGGPGDVSFANEFSLGGLHMALATEPAMPRLNQVLRDQLELTYAAFTEEAVLEDLGIMRQQVKELIPDVSERRAFWRRAFTLEVLNSICKGQWKEVKKGLEDAISLIGSQS